MAGDQVDRFIDILEDDAKKYENLADNLEALMEHLRGAQLERAKAETERRSAYANELRALAALTKSPHNR